eukprot:TRINITY_DN17247_c0_g1_i1.p2 TRINITY_DN17247_c0_g1~~TRINITY_DN17247_c0_g1_i1.p2  ORF type:complete len:283 (+),score=60.57 TRINITY_DN17247_c0_g1_i1:93-851(+)
MAAASSAAFVTGASRGIGLAMVERLLKTTAMPVVAAARTAQDSEGLQALQQSFGSRLTSLSMDVSDETSIAAAAEATASAAPRIGLLVHNAALMHPSGRGENTVTRLKQADMTKIFATNVIGPALLTKALYPRLKSASGEPPSKVVAVGAGVASISTNGAGGWYSYRASKTALNALMKNIAIEGKRNNVMTLTLYPEMVGTELSKPYQKGNPYPTLRSPEEVAERMMELIDNANPEDTGRFINIWSREDIPW